VFKHGLQVDEILITSIDRQIDKEITPVWFLQGATEEREASFIADLPLLQPRDDFGAALKKALRHPLERAKLRGIKGDPKDVAFPGPRDLINVVK
jgi:hypothetical protein